MIGRCGTVMQNVGHMMRKKLPCQQNGIPCDRRCPGCQDRCPDMIEYKKAYAEERKKFAASKKSTRTYASMMNMKRMPNKTGNMTFASPAPNRNRWVAVDD